MRIQLILSLCLLAKLIKYLQILLYCRIVCGTGRGVAIWTRTVTIFCRGWSKKLGLRFHRCFRSGNPHTAGFSFSLKRCRCIFFCRWLINFLQCVQMEEEKEECVQHFMWIEFTSKPVGS